MSLATTPGWRQPHLAPVLLLHLDGDFRDATGVSTFNAEGESYAFVAAEAGFGQAVRNTSVVAVWGPSTRSLSIGARPFCIEGRSFFSPDEGGGIVLGKNYFPSESSAISSGGFRNDFQVVVRPGQIKLSWTGQDDPFESKFATEFPEVFDTWFPWAVTDDGEVFRIYVSGVLVHSHASVSLETALPPESPAQVCVLNALQGFLGEAPNWGGSFYRGTLDEVRMFVKAPVHVHAQYPVATEPFTPR